MNAGANAFHVGEISQSQAIQGGRHLARSLGIQSVEPLAEGAAPAPVLVFADVNDRVHGNIYTTIIKATSKAQAQVRPRRLDASLGLPHVGLLVTFPFESYESTVTHPVPS